MLRTLLFSEFCAAGEASRSCRPWLKTVQVQESAYGLPGLKHRPSLRLILNWASVEIECAVPKWRLRFTILTYWEIKLVWSPADLSERGISRPCDAAR